MAIPYPSGVKMEKVHRAHEACAKPEEMNRHLRIPFPFAPVLQLILSSLIQH